MDSGMEFKGDQHERKLAGVTSDGLERDSGNFAYVDANCRKNSVI
jgi:hypothetical protein